MSEESAVRDEGTKLGGQFEQSPSRSSGDYGSRGHFGSARGQMERERREREGYDRRFMGEGERSASLERSPRDMKGEGPYGPPRGLYGGPQPDPRGKMEGERREREGYDRHFMREGERSASLERGAREMRGEGTYGPPRDFYGGPQPDPCGKMEGERREREGYDRHFMREGERSASLERGAREMKGEGTYGPPRGSYGGSQPHPCDNPIGYGRERMYGYGGKGMDDYGRPGRSDYGMDFQRFPLEGHRDFSGYYRGCGEPFRPEQWGHGDRYRGRHDRSRRGDYYGMGTSLRRGYSCAPSGYRNGPPGPFQMVHQSRYAYPGRYN